MKAFFDTVRPMFGGVLSQSQVNGLQTLLAVSEGLPTSWRAYMLATAAHETAYTMQPIKEKGGASYFRRMYDIQGSRPHVARALGNIYAGDGVRFAGRGYVQLTGRSNYIRAGKKTGSDLIENPDAAMNPELAGRIMIEGMKDGWFTGKGMADYLDKNPPDYRNARRIINGTDRAEDIARLARTFERALRTLPAPTTPQTPATGLLSALLSVLGLIIKALFGGRK